MMMRHALLRQQIQRLLPDGLAHSGPVRDLLDAVDDAYVAFDARRAFVERSLHVSSEDLVEASSGLAQTLSVIQATLECTADGILVVNQQGRIVTSNRKFAEMWAIPDASLEGKDGFEAIGFVLDKLVDPERFMARIHELLAQPEAESFDVIELKDGRVVERRSLPQRIDGKVVGRVLSFLDVTERRRGEAALKASERRYRTLFENNPQPMWVYDSDTLQFLEVNDAAVEHYGYSREEFLGMTIADIRPPEDALTLRDRLGKTPPGIAREGVWCHRRKDGTLMEVEVSSHDVGLEGRPARLVLATDVTQRHQLEQKLRQSQKMDALGRLAGGIAHDFNNLLNVITGYSDMLLRSFIPEDPYRGRVEQIRRAADRAAGLTRQLLAFSRQQVLAARVLDLNAIVADTGHMLQRVLGEDVELVMLPGPGLGQVKADPGQVEQILMNLAVNARDAMPEGGRLTIRTADFELEEPSVHRLAPLPAGPYVVLSVSDTGCGMDTETQARIFEPFFTTKPQGQGTGLGLATVYGIVEQSGGHIRVASRPGAGTTFALFFPRIAGAEDVATPKAPSPGHLQGSETVLVVEDEAMAHEMFREVLGMYGYQVLVAPDAAAAIELAAAHPGAIDLLLTDVVMPRMSGPDLAAHLRMTRPEIRVLFMSGHASDRMRRRGVMEEGVPLLEKPFTADDLAARIRDVLDAGADVAPQTRLRFGARPELVLAATRESEGRALHRSPELHRSA